MKKILFGCFAMYPSFVAGILNKAERIQFFVLCIENLNYEYYNGKFIGDKECSVSYKAGPLFQISYHGEAFKARIFPNRPSELMFAQSVWKNKIQLGCLVYGIITVKGRVICITNEVLSSRHNYVCLKRTSVIMILQLNWLIVKRVYDTIHCILRILVTTK